MISSGTRQLLATLNAVFPRLGTEVTEPVQARRLFAALPPRTDPAPIVGSVVETVVPGPDGHPLAFDQQAEVRFERHPIDPTLSAGNVMAFRFYGFPVPDFGAYLFEVHSGDAPLAKVPFWVVPAEGMAHPGEGSDARGGGYL